MKKRRSDLVQFFLTVGILCAIGLLSAVIFFKLDITAEKRNSLSKTSLEILESLEEPVMVHVYLHGEFPADYKRLEQAIEERLEEFNNLSDGLVEYDFIDPYEETDETKRQEIFKALDEKGLKFSNITYEKDGAEVSKIIWPGAIIDYKGEEYPVQFMGSEMPLSDPEMINYSVNNLEYQLASTFKRILRERRPLIGVLQGHKEIEPIHLDGFLKALTVDYDIKLVNIEGQLSALSKKDENLKYRTNKCDMLIIAGPDSVVPDKDRFMIDQFVMNGGKVLWLLDALQMNLDSLKTGGAAMAISNENGLYEMLYEYGVRLNRDMVIDFQGAPIILDQGPMGNQRSYVEKSNYFAPVLTSEKNPHPIAANLDPIFTEFAGSLDTVNQSQNVHKTPFLFSSELAKEFKAPVRIDLELLRETGDYFKSNNKPRQIMGLIMEGTFKSAFNDFLPDSIRKDPQIAYRSSSEPTQMIVISDSDIAYNEVRVENGKKYTMPLGYSKQFKRVMYDNQDLLLNCVNYLLDDASLIEVRSRNIKIRKLNKDKISNEKSYWQTLNTGSPLLVLALFGTTVVYFRRKRWITPN